MEYVKKDNPAGRLYHILHKANGIDPNTLTKEVWRKVLDAEYLTENEFLKRLIFLQELVEEFPKRIKSIEGLNTDLLLRRYNKVEQATQINNLSASWNNYRQHLDEATMTNLAFCAEELSRYENVRPIDQETLVNFDREVNELINKIQAEESLDPILKTILLDQLTIILRSIQEYRIRGAKGLRESLAYFYGMFFFNHKLFAKEKERDIIKETLGWVWKVTNVTLSAYKLVEIAYDGLKQLLP